MADITMSYFSAAMGRHVTFHAIVPFDTAEVFGFKEPFKTLYFLPGYSANWQGIVTASNIGEFASRLGFAVIIPDGENSFYVDQEDINMNMERYVAEELVAVTRKLFPLSHKREDTFIGGISMGGFGSLMLGARHPETFSKIIAMSPAASLYEVPTLTRPMLDYYFKSEENYKNNYDPAAVITKAKNAGADLPDIFLCCGEQDPLTYKVAVEFCRAMEQNGIAVTTVWGDGSHDTLYWNNITAPAVEFMLK